MRSSNILRMPKKKKKKKKNRMFIYTQYSAVRRTYVLQHSPVYRASESQTPHFNRGCEHLIHFNVPSKHIYYTHTHTPTHALTNPFPTSPSLLLAILIDRTEVVIIVKPIYPLLLSTKWNLDINNNKLEQISCGNCRAHRKFLSRWISIFRYENLNEITKRIRRSKQRDDESPHTTFPPAPARC